MAHIFIKKKKDGTMGVCPVYFAEIPQPLYSSGLRDSRVDCGEGRGWRKEKSREWKYITEK